MEIGVNVDPRHGFWAEDIAAPGVSWVRTVLLPPPDDLRPWLADCFRNNLKVLGVVARESLRTGWTYRAAANYYARRYGHMLAATQVGNEPDLRSPSSWTMRPERLARLLRAFRRELPQATLIGPGLASGQPSYLERMDLRPLITGVTLRDNDSLLDAIAIHPYGRGSDQGWPYYFGPVGDLLSLYRRYVRRQGTASSSESVTIQVPIWVTEFGGPERDFADEHERARYHSEMLLALEQAGVEVAMVFCWSDLMVPGFGLVDAQGNAKESYHAFYAAARALSGPS